jgi:phosphoribosylamine--glycine ligase
MNLLVLGSGGREHALAWKLAQSASTNEVFVGPGNPGISLDEKLVIVNFQSNSHDDILKFCVDQKIELVIVGPENLLADGIVDFLQENKILVFGPTQAAAQLESSKDFAKQRMLEAGIPTAASETFSTTAEAAEFIYSWPYPTGVALKMDGLAAGKGVFVLTNLQLAKETLSKLQDSGVQSKWLVEECLYGKEVSAFYLCQGENYVRVGSACDYKRLKENDEGPNTGGMGAFSPVSWINEKQYQEFENTVVTPILKNMIDRGTPFSGTLFLGFMMTETGPKLLEFNTRFGDPETQALMPLIDEDLFPVFAQIAKGDLPKRGPIKLRPYSSVHIVKAAKGYPGIHGEIVRKGDKISIPEVLETQKMKLFFSGVHKVNDSLQTSGGRVLGVTAMADHIEAARDLGYEILKTVEFSDSQMRTDIGLGR